MKKENYYDFLREKYADIIDLSDQVCDNCVFFCLRETRNTRFSDFGVCEYYMYPHCVYENESEIFLTKPDRCCLIKEYFDEDAFSANPALLDKYADYEAQEETEKWLMTHD